MKTVEDFFALLKKSELLNPEQFAFARGEVARMGNGVTPQAAAARLVERKFLTLWQSQQLLLGWKDFHLGRYKLVDLIGAGGMGQVYKAEHAVMGRLVAVKILSKARLNNKTAVERFRREVKAAAKLDHPNIITAHDAGQIADTHFLVMEYVEGQDLHSWIKAHGHLPLDWAAEFVRQAALGLEYARQKNMVHRDIKPGNLLVVWNHPDPPVLKILDMGLARFIADASEEEAPDSVDIKPHSQDSSETHIDGNLTQTGQILGTPDYLSPEQILKTHTVDIRSDIFSLGCTFYKLLTGQLPFGGNSLMEKLNNRIEMSAPPALSVRNFKPELPEEVAQIVARMIARDKAERFQTPGEIATALAPYAYTTMQARAAAGAAIPEFDMQGPVPMLPASVFSAENPDHGDTGTRDFLSLLANSTVNDSSLEAMRTRAKIDPEAVRRGMRNSPPAMTPSQGLPPMAGPPHASPVPMAGIPLGVRSAIDLLPASPPSQRPQRDAPYLTMVVAGIATVVVGLALVMGILAVRDYRNQNRNPSPVVKSDPKKIPTQKESPVKRTEFPKPAPVPPPKFVPPKLVPRTEPRPSTSPISPSLIHELSGHTSKVLSVDFVPRSNRAVSAGMDGQLIMWDLNYGKVTRTIKAHSDWINSVRVSPNGRWVATAGKDRTVRVWSLENLDSPPIVLEGHKGALSSVAFARDSEQIVSGDYEGGARTWNIKTGARREFETPGGRVIGVDFDEQMAPLAVFGSEKQGASCWNLPRKTPVFAVPLDVDGNARTGIVTCVAFSHNAKLAAFGTTQGGVYLLDLTAGKLKHQYTGHRGMVRSVCISPDEQFVVSGGYDGQVLVHRADEPESLALAAHKESVEDVSVSPDARTLLTASADGKVRHWRLPLTLADP